MSGINKYEEIRASAQQNFSYGTTLNELIRKAQKPPRTKPCVFLSHITEDKAAVHDVASYFADASVDYYLDVDDPELQKAVRERDDEKITKFIELGIKNCSHLLTIVSQKTQASWWVPFEVGYGKRGEIELASLALKEVSDPPSYLKITRQLTGIDSLNDYIEEIKRATYTTLASYAYGQGRTIPSLSPIHPLLNHLKMY